MPNEDQIDELKRIIEEERERKQAYRKEYVAKAGKQRRKEWRTWQRIRLRRLKEEMIALKGGKCADCGGVFPSYAYDFHHVGDRDMQKGMTFMNLSKTLMLSELNKCVLLCAICHRGRHAVAEEDNNE